MSCCREFWSGRRGSNPRPTAWKAVTLPLSYSRLRASAPRRARPPFFSRDGGLARFALPTFRALRRASPPRASAAHRAMAGWPALTSTFSLPLRASRWLASRSSRPKPRAKAGGEGRTRTFEATRATDLQSAAFDRSATSPVVCLESSTSTLTLLCCCGYVAAGGPTAGAELIRWSWRRDLNPRPADYKSAALPD